MASRYAILRRSSIEVVHLPFHGGYRCLCSVTAAHSVRRGMGVLDLFGGYLNSATPSCCQASVSPAKLGSARGHPSPDDAIRPPRARSPDQCRDSNVMTMSVASGS